MAALERVGAGGFCVRVRGQQWLTSTDDTVRELWVSVSMMFTKAHIFTWDVDV